MPDFTEQFAGAVYQTIIAVGTCGGWPAIQLEDGSWLRFTHEFGEPVSVHRERGLALDERV